MPRCPLIAGNWKMHMTLREAEALAGELAAALSGCTDREIMIAPPFTALAAAQRVIAGSPLLLGAQNTAWEEKGAFTGEISPAMLRDVGCTHAIVGHSERRHVFGESNALINKRLLGAQRFGLIPVLCIGETLAEREEENTLTVLESQLEAGLAGLERFDPAGLIIAYEPVWAIGTGKTATEQQAQDAHAFVRGVLARLLEKNIASQIRILYGGSVNPGNVDSLMAQPDIDGVLVGGASLKADSFIRIAEFR